MRFRRSNEVTVGARLPPVGTEARDIRRRRLYRLYAAAAIMAIVLVGFLYSRSAWIVSNGIVVGDLTAVTPLSQTRVKKLAAKCLDYVSEGQAVATLENELTVQMANQQLQQYEIDLAEAKSQIDVADKEAQAADSYYQAQVAVKNQLQAVFDAQNELMKKNYTATLLWQQAKADVAKAEAEARAAQLVAETKLQDKAQAELQAKLTQQRIDAFRASPELVGSYDLKAPKAGYLTQCDAFVGEVVNADRVLFQIFNPADAYVVVFATPDDAHRLTPGDSVKLKIGGLDAPAKGKVSGFYPELSGMPQMLTRYFWEQEKWSQFEPVRIDLVDLSDEQRRQLRSSAQVTASLWRAPKTGLFGGIGQIMSAVGL